MSRFGAPAITHRTRCIHDHVDAQARFLLELADVVALGAAEDLPVEMAEIVALGVFAAVGELDALAFERAFVAAAHRAFRDVARTHRERLELAHGLGGQEISNT